MEVKGGLSPSLSRVRETSPSGPTLVAPGRLPSPRAHAIARESCALLVLPASSPPIEGKGGGLERPLAAASGRRRGAARRLPPALPLSGGRGWRGAGRPLYGPAHSPASLALPIASLRQSTSHLLFLFLQSGPGSNPPVSPFLLLSPRPRALVFAFPSRGGNGTGGSVEAEGSKKAGKGQQQARLSLSLAAHGSLPPSSLALFHASDGSPALIPPTRWPSPASVWPR